jgi:hypothetical protein
MLFLKSTLSISVPGREKRVGHNKPLSTPVPASSGSLRTGKNDCRAAAALKKKNDHQKVVSLDGFAVYVETD